MDAKIHESSQEKHMQPAHQKQRGRRFKKKNILEKKPSQKCISSQLADSWYSLHLSRCLKDWGEVLELISAQSQAIKITIQGSRRLRRFEVSHEVCKQVFYTFLHQVTFVAKKATPFLQNHPGRLQSQMLHPGKPRWNLQINPPTGRVETSTQTTTFEGGSKCEFSGL